MRLCTAAFLVPFLHHLNPGGLVGLAWSARPELRRRVDITFTIRHFPPSSSSLECAARET